MKSTGIIIEYNPFHNGHLHHLNETKKMFKDNVIIAVMSGNFTQRGDVSIINKWDKTKLALNFGVDIVVELPFHYATQSADFFSKGALEILNELKVENIVFGSESGDINLLYKYASKLINDNPILINNESYPSNILKSINIEKPNDILGITYIKEIIRNKYNIKAYTIKRNTNYHSKDLKECSATSIREALKTNKKINEYIPYKFKYENLKFIEDYYSLLKYKILCTDDLSIYNGVDEGLENRIKKVIIKSNSLDELINNIKSKRYTYSRIKRMLLHILVSFTKTDNEKYKNINYIRILGYSNKGIKYLNKIKRDLNLPLITNFNKYKDLLYLEYKTSSIYDINNINFEFNIPIKKD
ncbi:MAG: nucleotidyltransferase [Bacilli bacterium]|nr:nucleotidyltransferase [Bacilli bacterium]